MNKLKKLTMENKQLWYWLRAIIVTFGLLGVGAILVEYGWIIEALIGILVALAVFISVFMVKEVLATIFDDDDWN